MDVITGDILKKNVKIICVPTHGTLNNGRLAMGRGLAKRLSGKYPTLKYLVGNLIKESPNFRILTLLHEKQNFCFIKIGNRPGTYDEAILQESCQQLNEWIKNKPNVAAIDFSSIITNLNTAKEFQADILSLLDPQIKAYSR